MKHILVCSKCRQYTMQGKCPKCGIETENPKPAKYNPDDPYGDYRRKAKEDLFKKQGLL